MNTKLKIAGAAVAVTIASVAAFANAPSAVLITQGQIQTDADSKIVLIDAYQQDYVAEHGKYWQYPAELYQTEAGQLYTLRVDEYVSPENDGYIIVLDATIEGVHYRKTIDKVNTQNSIDWQAITFIDRQ